MTHVVFYCKFKFTPSSQNTQGRLTSNPEEKYDCQHALQLYLQNNSSHTIDNSDCFFCFFLKDRKQTECVNVFASPIQIPWGLRLHHVDCFCTSRRITALITLIPSPRRVTLKCLQQRAASSFGEAVHSLHSL